MSGSYVPSSPPASLEIHADAVTLQFHSNFYAERQGFGIRYGISTPHAEACEHVHSHTRTHARMHARTHALRMHTSACYGIRPLLWRPANAHQQSRHHHGTPPCTPALYPAPNPGAMPHRCTRALHLSAALERCTRPLHATAAPERCTRALRPSTVLPMRPYVNAGREWLRGLRDPQRMSMADQPLW